MRREPVCADKWRGKEIVFLQHFPCTSTKNLSTCALQMQIVFHHVDPLMFAQDYRAEKCTKMPEARAELLY